MRRTLAIIGLLVLSLASSAQTLTPNIQLTLPRYGQANWDTIINGDFTKIDAAFGIMQVPYQGSWSNTTVYSRGQQVTYNGALYDSLINSNYNNLPTNTGAWMVLPNGGGNILNQQNGVVPLGTGPTSIGQTSHINENTDGQTTVTQPLSAATVIGAANSLPIKMKVLVEGSSIDVAYNDQGDSYISASSTGTGYSGTGTVSVTVATGSCTTTPALSALVNGSGGLTFALTDGGQCAVPSTFTTSISGFTGGSGASVTLTQYPNPYSQPWWKQWFSGASMSGRVTSYASSAVSGSTIWDVYQRFIGGENNSCLTGTYNWVLLDGGMFGNSLTGNTGESQAALTGAQAYNQWLLLYNAIRAAGCHVIFATPLNRGGDYSYTNAATYTQQIQILAPLVAASVQSGDYVLDWYDDLNNTAAFPFAQVAQTHFSGPGQTYVSGVADNEIFRGRPAKNINAGSGFLTDGLSVSGNTSAYQPNGFAVGYYSGNEYFSVTGPSVGTSPSNRNGVIYRTCDSSGATCPIYMQVDNNGNVQFNNAVTFEYGTSTQALLNLGTDGARLYRNGTSYELGEGSGISVLQFGGITSIYPALLFTGGANPLIADEKADSSGQAGHAAAYYEIGSNIVIPSIATGYHGSSGTKVQMSDGTGTSGNCPKYAADGSLTDSGLVCGSGSGDVTGPASSTAGDVATFGNTTGKAIQDAGFKPAAALGNQIDESANFGPTCTSSHYVSASVTATLPSSVSTGCVMSFQVKSGFTLTISSGTVTYTGPTTVTGPWAFSIQTDGTNFNAVAQSSSAGIANIQIAVGTTAVSANTCTSGSTATMTGLATTSTIKITPSTDVSSTTGWSPASGGQLYFTAWPTANTLNYKVCNPTNASITPGASTTWNVSAQ